MSPQSSAQGGDGPEVQSWEPERVCRRIPRSEALLSRGFLRCRPEKWFPGIGTLWTPVMHSFGCEVAITDIRASLSRPPLGGSAFVASIAGEPMLLALDEESAAALVSEMIPGSDEAAASVVTEYVIRKLFHSLVVTWTGPEMGQASFVGVADGSADLGVASVRVGMTVNTTPLVAWFGLGQRMVEALDGLWRRQIQSSSRNPVAASQARVEVAQLGVPPQTLSDYLKPGTVIDLEVKASEAVTVRVGGKAWMPGRMVNVEGFFGCEIIPGVLSGPVVPEGTTRLSVELGSVQMEANQLPEFGQSGSVLISQTPVGDTVNLVINQEVVAKARLCVYEGRFAIEVL